MAVAKKDEAEVMGEVRDGKRSLRGFTALFVTTAAVVLSLFQLYTAGIAPLTAIFQRSIHLVLIMVLTFSLYPPILSLS
jgi:TRAP-type uncharacterized transport system fused permease subunit